jgi:hypothetical protein
VSEACPGSPAGPTRCARICRMNFGIASGETADVTLRPQACRQAVIPAQREQLQEHHRPTHPPQPDRSRQGVSEHPPPHLLLPRLACHVS